MPVQELSANIRKGSTDKPKIPPNLLMSAEATAYPKACLRFKELKRQNKIIFEAEKERNALELGA